MYVLDVTLNKLSLQTFALLTAHLSLLKSRAPKCHLAQIAFRPYVHPPISRCLYVARLNVARLKVTNSVFHLVFIISGLLLQKLL